MKPFLPWVATCVIAAATEGQTPAPKATPCASPAGDRSRAHAGVLRAALVDIGLPGLDGYEVARRIRAFAGHGAMQLIAITGYGRHEDRERGHAAGFDAHLVKPVAFPALQRVIGEARQDRAGAS